MLTRVEHSRRVGETQEILFSAPDLGEDEIDAVSAVLRSGWITTGQECLALEGELAEYLGAEHVVAMASCTAALEIAVANLRLPAGSRIGVPTWTFVSTALAPIHRGLRPVLLDVDPLTLNVSAASLEAAIDSPEGLDAVIGVHFAGTPLEEGIHRLCAAAGLPLVEDAAHALGTVDHRGPVAGQGTAGACFSFYATKNLTSAEGGALVTDDEGLARFAQSFRLHGLSRDAWARYTPGARTGSYDIVGDGLKANLPDVLAAIGRVQLRRFDDLQRRRAEMDLRYREGLADIDGLRIVPELPHPGSAHHLLVVLLPEGVDRQLVQQRLSAQRIGTSIHFRPLHDFEWFAANDVVAGPSGTANAEAVAHRALSLPFHTKLTDEQIERVCAALHTAVSELEAR